MLKNRVANWIIVS